jgi:cytochrome c biogenesis protein CcmG, thiol:disulfide interchange protein DsbE
MTIRQQWFVVAGTVAALLSLVLVAVLVLGDELFHVSVGARAPEIHAYALDDPQSERQLADYKGQVVLLNIWATWCEPCKAEMPSMEALHREFSDKGLSIVAVSVDAPGSADRIRAFVEEYGLTFDILHDPEGRIQRDYQTGGVPETFVIGRDGIIRRKVWGADDWASPANRALVGQLVGDVPVDPSPVLPGDTAISTGGG